MRSWICTANLLIHCSFYARTAKSRPILHRPTDRQPTQRCRREINSAENQSARGPGFSELNAKSLETEITMLGAPLQHSQLIQHYLIKFVVKGLLSFFYFLLVVYGIGSCPFGSVPSNIRFGLTLLSFGFQLSSFRVSGIGG